MLKLKATSMETRPSANAGYPAPNRFASNPFERERVAGETRCSEPLAGRIGWHYRCNIKDVMLHLCAASRASYKRETMLSQDLIVVPSATHRDS